MSNEEPSSPKPSHPRRGRSNHKTDGGGARREPTGGDANANDAVSETEAAAAPRAETPAPAAEAPARDEAATPAPESPAAAGAGPDERPRLDLAALKEMGITKLASVAKSLEIPG